MIPQARDEAVSVTQGQWLPEHSAQRLLWGDSGWAQWRRKLHYLSGKCVVFVLKRYASLLEFSLVSVVMAGVKTQWCLLCGSKEKAELHTHQQTF